VETNYIFHTFHLFMFVPFTRQKGEPIKRVRDDKLYFRDIMLDSSR
jgi:hypothetical protein